MPRLLLLLAVSLLAISSAYSAEPVVITSAGKIEIRNLEAGRPYLLNRQYVIKRVPKELTGLKFTALPGNAHQDLSAKVAKGTVVYLALDSDKNDSPSATALHDYSRTLTSEGWKYFGSVPVSDERMENMRILTKTFVEETTIYLKGIGFIGSMLIAPAIGFQQK